MRYKCERCGRESPIAETGACISPMDKPTMWHNWQPVDEPLPWAFPWQQAVQRGVCKKCGMTVMADGKAYDKYCLKSGGGQHEIVWGDKPDFNIRLDTPCKCKHYKRDHRSSQEMTWQDDCLYCGCEKFEIGGTFEMKDEILSRLSLLIVDFGQSCCIYHEHGEEWVLEIPPLRITFDENCDTQAVPLPFAEIKAVLDAGCEPPLPRIEQGLDKSYRLFDCSNPDGHEMCEDEVKVYQEYIQNLPIWEPKPRGEWTNLCRPNAAQSALAQVAMREGYEYSVDETFPVQIWRYVRGTKQQDSE